VVQTKFITEKRKPKRRHVLSAETFCFQTCDQLAWKIHIVIDYWKNW